MQQGVQFTVDAFHEEDSTHELIRSLHSAALERGLPLGDVLSHQPDVVALFRTLLRDGAVDAREDENETICKCHRQGWILASKTAPDEISVRYTLPSPLHVSRLSWMLPTNDMPHFTSIFNLSLEVISRFKPSQLRVPIRRIGAMSMDPLPESQYQDEFYRSVFSATCGNVLSFARIRICMAGEGSRTYRLLHPNREMGNRDHSRWKSLEST
jgi:hypothetical protein